MKDSNGQLNLYDTLIQQGLNPSWATRKLNMVREVQREMVKNLVWIIFRRKSGGVVRKLATLNPAFLPKDKVNVMPRPNHPEQIIFWSVKDQGYRSFLAQNFLRMEQSQSINEIIQASL